MINDKIRFAARVIADHVRYPDSGEIDKALAGPDRADYLRAMFLAAAANDDGHRFVVRWLEKVRQRLGTGDPSDLQDAQDLMDVLEDVDIFEPVRRQETFDHAFLERFVAALKSEPEFSCMERVWRPAYDADHSKALWVTALGDGNTDEQQSALLAERARVDGVDLVELGSGVRSVPALRAFAANLTDEKLSEKLDAVLGYIAGDRGRWREEEFDTMAAVLGAEVVRRTGSAPENLTGFVREMLQRRTEFRDIGKRALPEFVRVAKACGCVDTPGFMALVCSAGTEGMTLAQLQEVLDAGMPVSIERPVTERNWNGSGLHLLSSASEEQIPMIASRMDEAQRRDFIAHALPHLLTLDAQLWSKRGVSCLDNNLLVQLNELGFELGGEFPAYKDGTKPLHEFFARDTFSGGDRAYPIHFAFTALHALGLRPIGERCDGMDPLHLAAIEDDEMAIRALVARGYDIEAKAEWSYQFRHYGRDNKFEGDTPLVIAVRHGAARAVAALIELGADVGVKAGTGATVMQLAKTESLKRIIRAARTGSSIDRAMGDGQAAKRNLEARRDPGIL